MTLNKLICNVSGKFDIGQLQTEFIFHNTICFRITVAAIDRKLPESSRLLWSLRGSTDLIVLYDWDSSVASIDDRSAIQSLKFALYKVSETLSQVFSDAF